MTDSYINYISQKSTKICILTKQFGFARRILINTRGRQNKKYSGNPIVSVQRARFQDEIIKKL